jgi:type I restriction enzyme S subunit
MVREKNVPQGYKQTEVGVIPEDWEIKRLGEIANTATGSTPSTKELTYYGNEYLFVSPADLGRNKYIWQTEKKLSKKGFNISRKFPKNSILFTCIGSTIGKMGIAPINLTSNQQINAVFPNNGYSTDFIYYNLFYLSPKIKKMASEQAVPIINKSTFETVQIPLPPLPEQKAIARVLSDVDELITSIKKLIDKKQKINQGTMQLLLTGKKRLPGFTGEWEVKRFGEVFRFLQTGTNSRRELVDEGNIKYIHYGDIHTKWDTKLDCSIAQIPYIEENKVKNLPLLKEGDLVMVDASEDYVGLGKSVEITNIGNQKIVAGLHTILLRGNKELVADGFKGYFQFIKMVKDSLCSTATGISVYGISKRNLQEIKIPLPSLPEQKAIAQILSDMDSEIEALEKKLEKYKLIKEGMMDKLLTGEVRLV